MKRREILALLGSLVLTRPVTARAQQKVWRMGWLSPADGPGPNHAAFLEALAKLGYEESRNIHIEWAWVGPRTDKLPEAAARLVNSNIDVLVTQSQACALAAQNATRTVPIVFVGVRDPVMAGLVTSMAHPGGNITGMTLTPNAQLAAKQLELVKEIVPGVSRVAVFWNPDVLVQAAVVESLKAVGNTMGIVVRAFGVHQPGDIERAFETISREKYDALVTLVEWFTFGQRALIARLAQENRIVTAFEVEDYVKAGGLISYGVAYHEHFKLAATYVDKILKGAKPADLPVQQPARLEMAINLKTAKVLGLVIPQSLLLRADEVIE